MVLDFFTGSEDPFREFEFVEGHAIIVNSKYILSL